MPERMLTIKVCLLCFGVRTVIDRHALAGTVVLAHDYDSDTTMWTWMLPPN